MLQVPQSTQEPELIEATQRRSRFRRIGAVTGIVVALFVIAGGILYWQATSSAIRLDFLGGRVEAALRERLPADASVSVGSTAVSYRRGQGIFLRIRDLKLALPGTATVAAAELTTRSNASVIFGRRIDLQSVTVSGVDIGVSAAPRLGREGNGAEMIRGASLSMMQSVQEADRIMRDTGLREVVVRDAAIHIDDADGRAGPPLRINEANWLPLGANRSKAWMQILEKTGHDWDMTLERRTTGAGDTTLSVEIQDLPVASLAPFLADNEGPYYRSDITLQARIAAAADGSFLGLRGAISTGAGEFSLTGLDEVNIEAATLSFVLGSAGDRITVPNGEVRTRMGRIRIEGVADLTEREQVTLLARVREGVLPTPIGETRTVPLIGGGMLARINFADVSLQVEQLSLATPGGTASMIGQASLGGPTPGLSFALSLTEMPAAVARALWPPFVATKTRGWFDLNVKGGTLGPATLQVALPPDRIGLNNRGKVLPDYALVGTVPFEDGAFTPIRTFPMIKDALGGISFGNATASIWAQTGVVEVPGRGTLQAGGTTLIIPELGRSQPRGDLHLELAGSAAALAAVSDTPPLAIAAKKGIVAETLTGEAVLSLDANIPISEGDFTDVIPTFRLALTNFSSTSPIEERLITEANLVLEGSPKSFTVRGDGTLDGYKASIDMILGTAAPATSAVTVSLSDEDRKRLGFNFGSLLTGTVLASLTPSVEANQQVALDLKASRISLPFFGWEKGPGVPATASFTMRKTPTGTDVSNFLLSGKGFEARGSLTVGTDGRLKTMELEKIALRSGDRLTASIAANGSGYDVRVRGAQLDARGILQGVRSGSAGGTADIFPIKVSLDLEVVKGQNDVALSNVSGNLTITKDGLDTASLKGTANSNQSFEWTLGREKGTRVLRLFADAGGALIRFAGIYSRVAGGNLIIDYSGPIGGAGSGVAVMRDFRLLNERALQPALGSTTQQGMAMARVQDAGDLHFTQLRIPFRQEGWVITIDDAALRGATLGATANGMINLPDGKMALSGTFIPAFGLNNIAGSIPILGAILGGGRDEGLLGITYKFFGPIDSPELVMNPISAIAPGIFRKIFEYR